MVKTFKICLSILQIYNIVLLTAVTMLNIEPPELIHLKTIPYFPPPSAGNHHSAFCSYEFVSKYFLWSLLRITWYLELLHTFFSFLLPRIEHGTWDQERYSSKQALCMCGMFPLTNAPQSSILCNPEENTALYSLGSNWMKGERVDFWLEIYQ